MKVKFAGIELEEGSFTLRNVKNSLFGEFFELYDKNNNILYQELSDGTWIRYNYDKNNLPFSYTESNNIEHKYYN